ncbi:MAG: carbohydrate kinase family protein [Geothrix sp.]|uniref:carbohydrate kinase family protein n=1 Tax=Geothrix sp. TaxID=1962974 RepID=UPI00184ADED0|nr:carbohydrate kinase family protein [Geothrix sp.]NWJ41890.1 carbohydrate kinase family protein [Geothrix sp.]WIL20137.1 MAG: carbohydrate kinase family protein [Geothrix sp.]
MESNFDVLVVGELNVDLILNGLPRMPEVGKEILAEAMTLTLGSSSAIFASNLSSIGAKVAFLGKVGEDLFGDLAVNSLRDKKVYAAMIRRTSDHATGATIVLNRGEDRAMVTYMGAMAHLTLADIQVDRLRTSRHMHFASAFLQPGLRGDVGNLFRRAKECGLTTSFDPQWDPAEAWDLDLPDILPYVDVFLPNEQELLNLTRKPDVETALDSLRPFAHTVVVKQGNQGAQAMADGRILSCPPFLNRDVVDAIGAGDSFDAGFVSCFIEGKSLEECLRFGNLMGAISTTAAGGTGAFTDRAGLQAIAKERFNHAF